MTGYRLEVTNASTLGEQGAWYAWHLGDLNPQLYTYAALPVSVAPAPGVYLAADPKGNILVYCQGYLGGESLEMALRHQWCRIVQGAPLTGIPTAGP